MGSDVSRRSRRRLWIAGLLFAGLHLVLTQYYLPMSLVFGPEPIKGDDFDVHIGQTWRVVEGLQGWGKSWVYDTKLLAGQPEGTIFDGDNKGWELWTFALVSLGVRKAVAFNSFVLAAFLAAPLLVWLAARLFGFGPLGCLLSAVFCSLCWFFDSFVHWVWWIGMVEYGIASCFALVPLALFHRFVRSKRRTAALGCALTLGAAHVLHPYSFFILAAPMAVLYALSFRSFGWRDHLAVGGIVACTVAINLYWLLPAFAHWHYILDSGYYAQSGPRFLLGDFAEVLLDPSDTGVIGTRTGFRVLFLAMSVGALFAWKRARDPRFVPFAAALLVCFVLSYFGPYIPFARQIQPYRHALPLCIFAAVGAAGFVEWLVAERVWAALPAAALALLGVLGLGVVQHLLVEVAYFVPHWVPESAPLFDGTPSPITRYGFLSRWKDRTHLFYGLPHDPLIEDGLPTLMHWIEREVPAGSRLLIDNTLIGERVAWKTHAEVIGGFELRNIAHSHANFFRRYGENLVDPPALARYLHTYAIDYTILQRPRKDFERATGVVEKLHDVGGRKVWKTRAQVSTVLQGGGIARARTNRIDVARSDSKQDVVLAYHWHEKLRCKPGCRVLRERLPFDSVGFVRVPAPHPSDFSVQLVY